MSNQETGPSKFQLAESLVKDIENERGLVNTGRVIVYGDEAPYGDYNQFTDIVVERTGLGKVLETTVFRFSPNSSQLRRHVIRHGGRFSEGKETILGTKRKKSL